MPRFADVILPRSPPLARPLYLPHTRGVAGESRHRQPCHRTLRAQAFLHRHRSRPAQHRASQGYEIKELSTLLDSAPVLRRPQLRFWKWIADYYLCSVGDVFKAAVPSGLKIESETQIACNDDFIEDTDSPLKEREAVLLDTLRQNAKMSIQELEKG